MVKVRGRRMAAIVTKENEDFYVKNDALLKGIVNGDLELVDQWRKDAFGEETSIV